MKNESIIIVVILAIILWFAVVGVYSLVWGSPNQKAEIYMLQTQVDNSQTAIEKYQAALKFENLFFMVADGNAVMDFEKLEEYIQERKDFYKRVE